MGIITDFKEYNRLQEKWAEQLKDCSPLELEVIVGFVRDKGFIVPNWFRKEHLEEMINGPVTDWDDFWDWIHWESGWDDDCSERLRELYYEFQNEREENDK